MWAGVVFVLLVGVPACRGAGYNAYQYYESEEGGDADLYDNYSDDVHRNPTPTTNAGAHTRNKRYDEPDDIRSLDFKDKHDVQGSLNKILYGNKLESLVTHSKHQDYTEIYDYVDKMDSRGQDKRNDNEELHGKAQQWSPSEKWWSSHIGGQKWSPVPNRQKSLQTSSSKYDQKEVREDLQKLMSPAEDVPRKWLPVLGAQQSTAEEETLMFSDVTQGTPETRTYNNEDVKEDIKKLLPQDVLTGESTMIGVQRWSPSLVTASDEDYMEETLSITMNDVTQETDTESRQNVEARMGTLRSYIGKKATRSTNKILRDDDDQPPEDSTTSSSPATTPNDKHSTTSSSIATTAGNTDAATTSSITSSAATTTPNKITTTSSSGTTTPSDDDLITSSSTSNPSDDDSTTSGSTPISTNVDNSTTTTSNAATTTTTQTTIPEKTTKLNMDINAIIAIIANLTYDYDWNLTEQFNKTLIDHGVPTCPTPSTPTTTTTTPPEYDFANTSVVGKCFVCGLKTREIPRNAHCADAFAGDFLPLVPVDPRARGKIASFRKYCRHLDVHNFVENPLEPRSIYGRFTGGCAVRWTDLSGVYTQRTCRSRFRPLTGKHFGSKRMAKLELALVNVENGCIISPMATLLPLSRGVSLYARFHACVCTGSWCNGAVRLRIRLRSNTPALAVRALIALLVCYIR